MHVPLLSSPPSRQKLVRWPCLSRQSALVSTALPVSRSPLVPRCRCGCRNSSCCSCSCCVHPPSPASLHQSQAQLTTPSIHQSPLRRTHQPVNQSRLFSSTISPALSYTLPIMAQEYKLKDISSLSGINNFDKVEAEVEGLQDGKVLLVKYDDKVHAISPKCTHYGAPLKLGVVSPEGRITCPWHGGKYFHSVLFGICSVF